MNLFGALAILCFLIWVVLAFVVAIPSGLVHIPLMCGVLLVVKAIVDSGEK